ncbi:lipase family protein [Roseibium sp. HPY-6]|uniref:lipase family protein n=1 Tax=Roseibium sp. HPY-6 TaxID=3229852 RepID=UPI00338E9C97
MTDFDEVSLRNPIFSWQAMLSLALISKRSYRDLAAFKADAEADLGMKVTAHADIADTQAYLVESDDAAVLVYRGTKGIADWLVNIQVFDLEGAFGDVHGGFLEAYRAAQGILLPPLRAASSAGKTLWLTGHSLGGAVAVNTAIETHGSVNVAGVATFGQPRLARRGTARKIMDVFGNRYYRFVNDDDVVPRVPFTYAHSGQLFHFDGSGQVKARNEGFEANLESAGPGEPDQGPAPLSEEEFKSLRQQIQDAMANPPAGLESAPGVGGTENLEGVFDGASDVNLEGFFPSVKDHRIDRYIAATGKQIR